MVVASQNQEFLNTVLSGKSQFNSFFDKSYRSLRPGELLLSADCTTASVYRLRSGWACQCCNLSDGTKALIDVYLPGDVIGLDAIFNTRPAEFVLALTSLSVDNISHRDKLYALVTHQDAALYMLWLQIQRQKRANRLLTAISHLDARGRLAVMILDFYKRLSTQRLISQPTYNLPLTQHQIASYLGLTVVHVNRVLKSLRQQEIISLEKHCVTVLNLAQLKKLAGVNEDNGLDPEHCLADGRPASAAEPLGQMDELAEGPAIADYRVDGIAVV